MAKAVIYARFSSDMQREESIDAQIRACEEYADKNDITIIKTYSDEAISAKNDKRPNFQLMMREIEKLDVDVVLIHKTNRFARNMRDHLNYEYKLNNMGINLISANENFGEGKSAFLAKGINQLFSQYFLMDLAEEVRKGHRENALKALFNGGDPPFGYNIVDKKYVINEYEAFWVKKLFDAALRNKISSVLKEMEDAGVKTKRGNTMKYSTVYDMLRNEKYIGVYVYSVEGTRYRHTDTENCVRIEDIIPAIIDAETFEKVNKSRRRATVNEYLTKGLVWCECGKKMTPHLAKKRNEKPYYYCANKECEIKTIQMGIIENYCKSYVKNLLSDEVMEELGLYIVRYRTCEKQRVMEFNAVIKSKQAEKEKQIQTLVNRLASPDLPQEAIGVIGEQIATLKKEINSLSEQTPPPQLNEKSILHWINNIKEDLNYDNIQNVIEKIVITKNKEVKITSTLTSITGVSPLSGGGTPLYILWGNCL